MKLNVKGFESFLRNPDETTKIALVFGADVGLVEERFNLLTKMIVPDMNDLFQIAEITPDMLKEDPFRLYDESAELSFSGKRKVIRIKNASNKLADIIKKFLAEPVGDAFIILSAGELKPNVGLRKLIEPSKIAVAIPCYMDEAGSLQGIIQSTLAHSNVSIEKEALDYLTKNLGSNRLVTRSELEKLAVYVGEKNRVTIEDAKACVDDTSAQSLDDLSFAIADGNPESAMHLLNRIYSEGTTPIGLVRTVMRHFQRLHVSVAHVKNRKSIGVAVSLLRPPVFFKYKSQFENQVRFWSEQHISRVLEILFKTERECKTTNNPAEILCERAFLQISLIAKSLKSRR
ncbi:MAG: DNA polymerase III subunit delta [Alphaproteobacteria bacterium]|nr:DNA polymerase III subunit delta [Alphaproteobacteria bacterium]